MKTVLICTYMEFMQNRLFDISDAHWNHDNRFFANFMLKKALNEQGFECKTIDVGNPLEAEWILFFDIPPATSPQFKFYDLCVRLGLQNKMILLLVESPVVWPQAWNKEMHKNFVKILTWNDDLVDNERYFKINYAQPFLQKVPQTPFTERKLCTMIAGNKYFYHPLELYSKRIEAIRAFERLSPYQFDLYGTGWNRPNSQVENAFPFLVPHYPSYKGNVIEKAVVLSKYKYCICYENMLGVNGFSGYITEKIHHCFMSGCIPVYLGANNISSYIPTDVFIDRRSFESYEHLYAHMIQMKEMEFMGYFVRMQAYLQSTTFEKHFSVKAFVDILTIHLS